MNSLFSHISSIAPFDAFVMNQDQKIEYKKSGELLL